MTREEFIQECALRMVAPGKTDNDYLNSIYRFSTDLARYVYGPTEEEKKFEQEEEARLKALREEEERISTKRSEKQKQRAKELKDMPKQYILVYYEYKYNTWRDYTAVCKIKSSAVMNQEEMVRQDVAERKRWSYETRVFEYCFITEEQAMNILTNEPKKDYNSKKLTGVTGGYEWKRLVSKYGLEVRKMEI